MRLAPEEARRRFALAPVARLATVTPDGHPHLVPMTFALEGDTIYSIVDAKPKDGVALARLRNIEANPLVSLLTDDYADDWERLWWVRADGQARVVENGADRERAIELLRAKYAQYADPLLPFGAAMVVAVERWVGWVAGSTLAVR
jgi:PPOX class probable F420-dependent enzyme